MISFVIGTLVTVFTFYIALIYSSVTIGLLGFAEAILLVLAFLFLLWYRRKIEADIQIPIAVAEPGGKSPAYACCKESEPYQLYENQVPDYL